MLLDYDRLGWLKPALLAFTMLVAAFLLLPVIFIVLLSFGSSRWLAFPPPGWTLKWYQELFADPSWIEAALTSARIAAMTAVLAVGIGMLASFALVRGNFGGREILRGLLLTPMVLPVVVFAIAIYAFFLRLGLGGTTVGFVIAHTVLALPFAIIPIATALEGFDKSIEDAAIVCGASPMQAKLRITLPSIRIGIFSAAIFSFLASWDEVVVAIFMASPTLQTLPVKIWGSLRSDLTPVIAAASSLLVALTLALMVATALLRRKLQT
ncbi:MULTISPECIES: ABC transporter permease [unclassified Mesorhizobium]|uniref:ABC transporter permease n=1 Tax=unclassified Mesorhizobium TaxID=325217 RepID=UPI000BAEA9E2|nr:MULTISPECIES: ABC transporter permease [unclassified Mesorhizobium]TGT58634.1 ABC transporter permease [Mesorhizobium sp. M00.F.Ca.ET.170.01.1.1]AZO12102.1 ABC transporter permease [Mesorhizobium sp. M3A.F.Ca.ET.080.04.2.1]PBB84390.1 ABC transporter permease [Mesorhizobium sp. WSM3876]RWB74816.1 MAG: ABC transporter permease [Mesorhizobium sp.]RWB89724.1 MAG: ABC transporter permease [Mesorhizobium sp.]